MKQGLDANMAARKDLRHSDEVRARIQTSQLVNRLTSFINGKIELSAAQVTAALGLLRKSLPDLTAVEHSGEVEHAYAARLPTASKTMDEWQNSHADSLTPPTTLQ